MCAAKVVLDDAKIVCGNKKFFCIISAISQAVKFHPYSTKTENIEKFLI